jgi:hypothetical protein
MGTLNSIHFLEDLPLPGHRMDAQLVHQAQNSLMVDAHLPLGLEINGDPSIAIGPMRCLISFQNPSHSL